MTRTVDACPMVPVGVVAGVGCGFLMWVARWPLPLEEQERFTGGGVRDLDGRRAGRRAGSWEEQRRWVRVGFMTVKLSAV